MLGKLFDLTILGNDLSGLLTGALMVKRGFNVLVLDVKQERQEIQREGYTLRKLPNVFVGFGQGQIFSEIFTELGLPFLERKRFELAQPAFQVVMPGVRLDISQEREELFNLCNAEFPSDGKALSDLSREMDRHANIIRELIGQQVVYPPVTLREKWRVSRALSQILPKGRQSSENFQTFLKDYQLSPEAKDLIMAQIMFLSSFHPEEYPLTYASSLLSWTNKSIFSVEGGVKVLENLCRERITSYRGSIQQVEAVEQVDFRKFIEITVSEVKEPVKTKTMLITTNPQEFFSAHAPKYLKSFLKKKLEIQEPAIHSFTYYIGISDQVVPVGMEDQLILVTDPGKDLFGANMIFVRLSPRGVTEYAPEGKRLLTATVLLKPDADEISVVTAKELAGPIHDALADLMPFFDEFLDFMAIEESYALYQAERRVGLVPRVDPDDPFGVAFLPNHTPHDKIFYTGPLVLPGLGMEGEGIAALQCANLLTEKIAK